MRCFKGYIRFLIIGMLLGGCHQNKQSGGETVRTKAHQLQSNSIEVSQQWARPGGKGGNSATYFTVFNGTDSPDTLIAVQTNGADKAEIHESFEENGMMGMRPAGQQTIAPDSTLTLQPGGLHLMLMQLKQDLAHGDSVDLVLTFSASGDKKISAPVKDTF